MTERQGTPPVVLSMGDPNGIGPEVLLKSLAAAWHDGSRAIRPIVFGNRGYLTGLSQSLSLGLDLRQIEIVDVAACPFPPRWGRLDAQAGSFALRCLSRATSFCRDSGSPLLVTAPLNKKAAALSQPFPAGQTEFVASFFPGSRPAMAFFSDRFHVVLATVHIPLRKVADSLSVDLLEERGTLFFEALRGAGMEHPRIAVCGLNPHASEEGLFGDEEARIVAPAIERLNRLKGGFEGPFPPDTIFRRLLRGEFDGIVALYHDQGLIPLKMVAFDSAVNVTLGLPIVRTSPDHGTAFDIAGQGRADPSSMQAAIRWGLRLCGARLSV